MTTSQTIAYLQKKSDLGNHLVVATVEPLVSQNNNQIMVKNTGNVAVYLRVHCALYQENSDQSLTLEPGQQMKEFINLEDDWILDGQIYYYKQPVAPGKELRFATISKNLPQEMQLDVYAESIQQNPSKAITEAWGITVDESGELIVH
ncbi:hypothetical protein [Granulicatella balaenopterae]|nr:hypothetical protein [Granulicatella balaenopterae]